MPVSLAEVPDYAQMTYRRPSLADIEAEHRGRMAAWREATSVAAQLLVLRGWNDARKALDTTQALAHLRYEMDTQDAAAKAEKEFFDDAAPRLAEWGLQFLKAVVASPHRSALEKEFGAHAFRIWEMAILSFDPVIADDRRAEAKVANRYTEILASLRATFAGKEMNLSLLGGHYGDRDRSVRLAAQQARMGALAPHVAELDGIFDELVQLRHGMARKMGHETFTQMAYVLRQRDYSPQQVAAYRDQVRDVLVPLASRIRARDAERLGVKDYAFHDTFVRDLQGVPRPDGDHDWMLERATRMFAKLGADFGQFWEIMLNRHLLDLKSRDGKAGGGFCTDLAQHGVPFIFANFNGTEDDVNVFTHECGHAFQAWRSLDHPLVDYVVPTFDAAEIHSMSLEMLCHPHMDLFFGDDASRYRSGHLERAILFLPYGVAIDEFQHRVYANPEMSPQERAKEWQDLEATYLPERRYPAMPFAASGRAWQVQRHVYLSPFYYIDYCLAQTCALQFWQLAQRDRDAAMASYRRICDVGGSKPFSGIVADAGLKSPFAEGTIASLASALEKVVLG
jgi:M3 family oligoendopeptidase